MIHPSYTRWNSGAHYPLAANVTTVEDGQALVLSVEDNVAKAKPSAGTSGEIFLGIAYSRLVRPSTAVFVETVTGPDGGGAVTLTKTPKALASTSVRTGVTALTVQAGAANDDTEVQLVGAVLTFHADSAGIEYVVTYRYDLTLIEARNLFGDGIHGPASAVEETGVVGVITDGEVWTSNFDPSDNWAAANIADIKTGASGEIVRAGNGAAIRGHVMKVPDADFPFLGISFTV